MEIKLRYTTDEEIDLSFAISKLKSIVNVDQVSPTRIEFESKGMFSYLIVGGLFTIVDYGELQLSSTEISYKVVSVKYWFIVGAFYLIMGILPGYYFLGLIPAFIVSLIAYFIIRIRHIFFLKELFNVPIRKVKKV